MSNLGGGCFSPGREIIEANNKAFQPRLKKQRSRNIFKVALSKMRGRSEKPKAIQVDDDGSRSDTWRKVVGSMRTLQMQDDAADHYSSAASSPSNPTMVKSPSIDRFESFPNSPLSNFASSSRYSSAVGLDKLVENDESLTEYEQHEKEDITKKHDDDDHSDGDDMIDAKAEEFIAEFYLQMKLQKFNKMDPHYRKISQRSLGL
ncbi:hypothetical protein HN51_054309 [Arachis hypogaea]|uniref:Uncharacterized protein n=1 Tax=Arachis hypogaea TaxID=3818 RepID=A0A444XHX9_ARAHY|nr:uncharacterized protein LOC110267175 [Arachis ipaensis]XP_025677006.1 uncharacterized protein LOC112776942 [Arachis hypogaea]QHN76848.1 uncharacterized protein DS421_19g647500 [Arachis hypogaea]RYQ88963.1 hypothetical protein Ahy_B09g095849 [Arachis hypogaea]